MHNFLFSTLDITFLKNCGSILAHTYKRLKKVNIKDKDSFLNAIDKVLEKYAQKIDTLEKAKNVPCVFNNWSNFYKGKFISNTILNANAFEKIIK